MARTIISAGTLTVTNGSTAVTGTGTNWSLVNIKSGDQLHVGGVVGIIASVTSDTEIVLSTGWKGASATGAAYQIELFADLTTIANVNERVEQIIRELETGLYGADAYGKLAGKDAYDDEGQGFVYAVTDDASGDLITYIKETATSGDWAGPFTLRGAGGTDGLGWTGGSYSASTGKVTFASDQGLGFETGDLRGADGTNYYNPGSWSASVASGTIPDGGRVIDAYLVANTNISKIVAAVLASSGGSGSFILRMKTDDETVLYGPTTITFGTDLSADVDINVASGERLVVEINSSTDCQSVIVQPYGTQA